MGLEGAQTIGGVAVEITGDLSKLRAAHAEAKTISTEISKLQPKVQIGSATVAGSVNGGLTTSTGGTHSTIGGASVNGSTPLSMLPVGSFANGLGLLAQTGSPNRFTDIRTASALRGLQSNSPEINRAEIDGRMFAGRMTAAREAGAKAGSAEAEAHEESYNRTRRRMSGAGGGEGNGGGGFNLARFNPFSERGLGRIVGSVAVGYAIGETLKGAGDFRAASRLMGRSNYGDQLRGEVAMNESIAGIPFLGQIYSSASKFSGYDLALGRKVETYDQGIAASAAAKLRNVNGRAELATLSGNEEGAVAIQAEEKIKAAREENRRIVAGMTYATSYTDRKTAWGTTVRTGEKFNSPRDAVSEANVKNEETIRDKQIAAIQAQRTGNFDFVGAMGAVNTTQIDAMHAGRAGDSDFAATLGFRAQGMAIQAQGDRALVGVNNPKDRATIKKNTEQQLDLLGAQADDARQERKKNKAIDTETAIASKQEATLRMAHRGYEADLAAFDAATKAKIDAIDDLDAKKNESDRRGAQRAVMVQQQAERTAGINAQLGTAGQVALMRAGHQNQAADLVAFDAETTEQLRTVDASSRAALIESRRQQREALVQQQTEQRFNAGQSVNARIGIAGAEGAGMGQLAGTIGAIAGMKGELRGADKTNQAGIVEAQEAELRSMQQQILAPRRFATEFDPTREATGGPGGDAAKETNTILRIISEYLKALVDKGPAAAAG